MASFVDLSCTSKSTYPNIQNNLPIKLTLYERVSQLFSYLYEKISNLFSREPNQIKKLNGIEPIYDVPKNNQPVKKLTLYERVSNFFSRGPSRTELLEERMNKEITQLQQEFQKQQHCICINVRRANSLENSIHDIKDRMDSMNAKEAESNSDSGFSDSMEKKPSFLSIAKSYMKQK